MRSHRSSRHSSSRQRRPPPAVRRRPGADTRGTAPAGGQIDPPARVGRLAKLTGTVSFRTPDLDHWEPATLNYPITSNNMLWTEPQSQAEVEVSGNRIVMDQTTELDVDQLDNQTMTTTEPQGELYLRLVAVPAGQSYTVRTPRGIVTIAQPGKYEVAAGDTEHPTTLTVIEGAAQVSGDGFALEVAANQEATIYGSDTFQASVSVAQRDAFLNAELAIDEPPPPPPQVPAVVAQMTGGTDLTQYGDWQSSPEYGQVWYPKSAGSDYVPYRNGSWSYVEPWGWTWVDDAPWGFAPSHYGRWVDTDAGWGWAPVAPDLPVYAPPVYAPAVVDFFGLGAAAVGAAVGFGPRFRFRRLDRLVPDAVGLAVVSRLRGKRGVYQQR